MQYQLDEGTLDAAELLRTLFEEVCILDARGKVARSTAGKGEWLQAVQPEIRTCLLGEAFETAVPGGTADTTLEIRGIPLGEGKGAVVAMRERPATEEEFLARNMRQGLMRLDAKGVIRDVNPALASWLRTTRDAMIGKSVETYLVAGKLDGARDLHEEERYLAEFQTSEGLRLSASVTQKPIWNARGVRIGALAMVTDLTAQHAMQSELVAELMRMTSLATRDPLTGLMNRRAFELAMDQAAERAGDEPYGIILLDLDKLKETNDAMGHAAGDAALKALAEKLKQVVRESDHIGRLGGDEFAVLIQPLNVSTLQEIAERVAREMNFVAEWEGGTVEVVASVGSAHSSLFGDGVLRAADIAMYKSKRLRRDGFAAVELDDAG